jgi:hypothetical protein
LFLSVDLVGSTAFKSRTNAQANNLYPEWVDRFRNFYKTFPDNVDALYRETKSGNSEEEKLKNGGPKVWKTIGDEILFCTTVTSLRHLSCCITAFLAALDEYGRLLETSGVPLDVKGSGWIASFPAENIAIAVNRSVSIQQNNDIDSSEKFELAVDQAPFAYDFLGKAIDTGFRIAKNAATDRFTASIELGFLLAKSSLHNMFSGRFSYHGRETFKGVLNSQPYPVVSIDTERNPDKRNVRSRERVLTQEQEAQPLALHDFLLEFMRYERIELPVIVTNEGDKELPYPPSYERFRKAWRASAAESEQRDENLKESILPENADGEQQLATAVHDFAKRLRDVRMRAAVSLPHDVVISDAIERLNSKLKADRHKSTSKQDRDDEDGEPS